jgi:uncharacterized protein YaaR (DUF327 family)
MAIPRNGAAAAGRGGIVSSSNTRGVDLGAESSLQQRLGELQQRQAHYNASDRMLVEIDGMKQQFGVLEQHVLAELKARRNAEKSLILPQLDGLSETVVRLEAELMEAKQSNKTLQLMIKERDREFLQGGGSISRSEFDLLKADLKSINYTVKELSVSVAGVASRSPAKQRAGDGVGAPSTIQAGGSTGSGSGLSPSDLAWLQSKVDDALDELRSKQAIAMESMMQYINGKMYQDLVRRLETTESKVALEVGALKMNHEVEATSAQAAMARLKSDMEGDNKLFQSNMNNVLSEFNSLRSITRAEIEEAVARIECAERSWETSVSESLRSIDGEVSHRMGHMQVQHDELKGVVAAEIASRRNMDKKHAAVMQTFMDKTDRETAGFNQDLINLRDQCNARMLAVENSIAMVASSFASQMASLQESTSAALHILKKEISSRPVPKAALSDHALASHAGLSREDALALIHDEEIRLNKRVDELRSRQEAGLYKFSNALTELAHSTTTKLNELETNLQNEVSAREADYERLQAKTGPLETARTELSEKDALALAQDEAVKLNKRLDEQRSRQEAGLYKFSHVITEFTDSISSKMFDLEESLKKETGAREADYKRLQVAMSTAMITQSKKVEEETNSLSQKITKSMQLVLELMDTKISDLEQSIREDYYDMGGGGHGSQNFGNDEDGGPMRSKFKSSNSAESFPYTDLGLPNADDDAYEVHEGSDAAPLGRGASSGSARGSQRSLVSKPSAGRLRGGSRSDLRQSATGSDAGSVLSGREKSQSMLPPVEGDVDDYASDDFVDSASMHLDPSAASLGQGTHASQISSPNDHKPNAVPSISHANAKPSLGASSSAVSINESIASEIIEEDFTNA